MKKIAFVLIILTAFTTLTHKALAQAGVPVSLRGDFNRMQSNMSNQIKNQRLANHQWFFWAIMIS